MTGRKRTAAVTVLLVAIASGFWLVQRRQMAGSNGAPRRDFTASVPVTVAVARPGAVRDSFSVVGVSSAWRDVDIHSEASGTVRAVSVEVGQKKAAGAVLLRIDDELAASALRKAEVNLEIARRDFERYRNLQQEGAVPVSSYESKRLHLADTEADLVAARRKFRDAAIRAPFSGIVTSRQVEVGDLVQQGMKVANMVDLSRVKIRVSVPEKKVPMVVEGMPVQVTSDLFPGSLFRAVVTSVSSKSSKDHTYQVEAVMDNPKEHPFRAGMFARAAFVGNAERQSLLIPRKALVGSIGTPEVFVVRGGVARRVRLLLGAAPGERVEVLGGIASGEQVVVSGQNELAEGTPVAIVSQEQGG